MAVSIYGTDVKNALNIRTLTSASDKLVNITKVKEVYRTKNTLTNITAQRKAQKFNNHEFKKKRLVNKESPIEEDEEININKHLYSFTNLIFDTVAKIETIAKPYLNDSKTIEQKKNILQAMEDRIEESLYNPLLVYNIDNLHTTREVEEYSDIVRTAIEVVKNKITMPETHTTLVTNLSIENVVKNKRYNGAQFKKFQAFFDRVLDYSAIGIPCKEILVGFCDRMTSLQNVQCGNGQKIYLENLCNGYIDCSNKADELNCHLQVAETLRLTMDLLSDVENSTIRKCLPPEIEKSIFTANYKHWRNMLNALWSANRHFLTPLPRPRIYWRNSNQVNSERSRDITLVVSGVLSNIEGHVCSPLVDIDKSSDIFNIDLDYFDMDDGVPKDANWSPTLCTCNHQFCKLDDCDPRCRRICWQIFILDHWGCPAVAGGTSISLDLICDGKVDCTDESDEKSCAIAVSDSSAHDNAFANAFYNSLLEALSSITLSENREINKIAKLTDLTKQLQKLTTKSNPDVDVIKTLRNGYFENLVAIFKDMMPAFKMEALNNVHDFLLLLNGRMISALKCSHSGNKYMRSQASCECKDGICVSVVCPRHCKSICQVEHTVLKYSCLINHISVDITAICNGKEECPNGEDEKNCKQEKCKSHHLNALRRNLQTLELPVKDAEITKLFDDWKIKVTKILQAAESENPNRKVFEWTIAKILNELASAYGSIEDIGNSNTEIVLKEFTKISDVIKQMFKSCKI